MDKTQDCFEHQKFVLMVCGFSASNNIFYRLYSISLPIMCTIFTLSFGSETVKRFNRDQDLIFPIAILSGQIIVVLSMYWMQFKRFDIGVLLEQIKTFNNNFNNTEDNKKLLITFKKFIIKQGSLGEAIGIIAIIVLVSAKLSIDKENWVLPLRNGFFFRNDIFKFVAEVVMFYIIISFCVAAIFLYINVLTLVCCYCQLLVKHILNSMSLNEKSYVMENNLHEVISWQEFKIKLQYIVDYHVGIIRLVHQIEKTLSVYVMLFYGAIIISLCLTIYHGTIAKFYSVLLKDAVLALVAYLPLVMISIWGEQVITESKKISAACCEVYCIDVDLRIQKSILIIMMASCEPIILTVGGLRAVGLSTLVDVSRTIYGYYTVIRSIYNR